MTTTTTILGWFTSVANKELRKKLLKYMEAEHTGKYRCNSMASAVHSGFTWDATPEGHHFWACIHGRLHADDFLTVDAAYTEATAVREVPVVPKTSTMVMERAGFKIPVTIRPSKPDPRGSEYGYFVVENTDNKYIVTKCDKHRNTEWSATFSEDSFLAWARDYT